MLKNLSLSQKLAIGFGVVIVALVIVGAFAVMNITRINEATWSAT